VNVTQVTREQYVAIVECGGKAFGFSGVCSERHPDNDDYARVSMVDKGLWDDIIDPDFAHWVYYTLTE